MPHLAAGTQAHPIRGDPTEHNPAAVATVATALKSLASTAGPNNVLHTIVSAEFRGKKDLALLNFTHRRKGHTTRKGRVKGNGWAPTIASQSRLFNQEGLSHNVWRLQNISCSVHMPK